MRVLVCLSLLGFLGYGPAAGVLGGNGYKPSGE